MAPGKTQKAHHIKKLVKQLQDLEMELLFGESYRSGHEQEVPLEAVEELKSIVDSLRSSIWCYLQCRQEHSNQSVAELTNHYRMRRVVEMLRQARVARRATASNDISLSTLELMTKG